MSDMKEDKSRAETEVYDQSIMKLDSLIIKKISKVEEKLKQKMKNKIFYQREINNHHHLSRPLLRITVLILGHSKIVPPF